MRNSSYSLLTRHFIHPTRRIGLHTCIDVIDSTCSSTTHWLLPYGTPPKTTRSAMYGSHRYISHIVVSNCSTSGISSFSGTSNGNIYMKRRALATFEYSYRHARAHTHTHTRTQLFHVHPFYYFVSYTGVSLKVTICLVYHGIYLKSHGVYDCIAIGYVVRCIRWYCNRVCGQMHTMVLQ